MATKKITELSELQLADVAADLSKTVLLAVDESGGTPVTKKVTLATIDSAVERSINTSTTTANAAYDRANSAGVYANAAFATANTLLDGSADAFLNSLIVPTINGTPGEGGSFLNLTRTDTRLGNDSGNVQMSAMNEDTSTAYYLTLANTDGTLINDKAIQGQYFTVYNENYLGDLGYSGGNLAMTANVGFQIGTDYFASGEDTPLWTFGTDGSLTVPGNIYANAYDAIVDTLTANTVTSVNVISSNIITANNLTVSNNFSVSGVTVQWHPAPLTSKGHANDKAGYIAIDDDKIYRCIADYTDGNADIWVYVNFTGGTWG